MNNYCPRYLYRPLQVLWWEVDEFAIVMIFFTLALIYGSFFWLLMIAVPYGYSKFKKNYPRGFIFHLLWFIGLLDFHGYPTAFEKEFFE